MTDFLKVQNEHRAALLARTFADWERRLRGWQVWDYAVGLEPVFISIKPPAAQIIAPVRDDARVQRGFGRLFGGNPADDQPEQITACAPEGASIKPTAFYRDEPLSELSIILPREYDISAAICEQFFLSLGNLPIPASFEILADSNSISIQFACDISVTSHLENQVKTFFPACLINTKQTVLKSHFTNQAQTAIADFGLARQFLLPIQTFRSFNPDPLTGLFGSLANLERGEKALIQILFQKARANWTEEIERIFANPDFKSAFNHQTASLREKFSAPLFAVLVRVGAQSADKAQSWNILRRIGGTLSQFSSPNGNELIALSNDGLTSNNHFLSLLTRTSYRSGMLLNAAELASLAHLPSNSLKVKKLPRDVANSKAAPDAALGHSLILGINAHQGLRQEITLSEEQRTKHCHLIGASGSGKSTLLLKMMIQDLAQGNGFACFDPHGDLIDSVIEHIPESRIKDVIVFDPSDAEFPIGFNILQAKSELEKTLLSSDLVATFRRMSTSWGDVMDSVLANAILAFVESDRGGTLFELKRFLVEKDFRSEFLKTVQDEGIKYFWQNEFPLINGKPQSSILIRLDTFLRQKLIRNIVCQKENKIDFREVMDNRKVLLIKLSQGAIGEENSYLLGTLLVSKLYQTALSRQDTNNRPFFSCYLDEFHHFITPSMESILSGVRKYNLGLVLAHQEFRQLQSRNIEVASSVLSNCYTRICFRLGDTDAEKFASGFSFFDAQALQNLSIGEAVGRIERSEYDFNLRTDLLPKVAREIAEQRKLEIIRHSQETCGTPKNEVESQINFGRVNKTVSSPAASTGENIEPETPEKPIAEKKIEEKFSEQPIALPQPKKPLADSATSLLLPSENVSSTDTQQHKYLQSLVKRMAESKGFRATVEKEVFGGAGRIDVALESETRRIACEISVFNEPDYELQNIQKCLLAGYTEVMMISANGRHLEKIRQKAEKNLSAEDFARVRFFTAEEFHTWLENLESSDLENESKVKGFKVKVKLKPVDEASRSTHKKAISDIVFGGLKKLIKKGKDE